MIVLRDATPDDIAAFVGCGLPQEWAVDRWILGDVLESDGEILAYGVVSMDRYGRIWGWFSKRATVSRFLMHRQARAMIETLRRAGSPALYVICHPSIPGAAMWLQRLGFAATGVMTAAGEVWRLDFSWVTKVAGAY